MKRLLRHGLLALVCVLVLGACSQATRIAYSNATSLAIWYIDDWFDLREEQRDWLKARLNRYFAWHRANELPAYEKLLLDAAGQAGTRVTEEDVRRIYGDVRKLTTRAVEQALPDMAEFLLKMQPEQVAYLEKKYADENAKALKQAGRKSALERQEVRAKRFIERIEDWTGRLSPGQRELVRTRLAVLPDITDEWLADRRQRQADTIAIMRNRPSRDEAIKSLRRLMLESDAWRKPEYAAKVKARDEQTIAMIVALEATLTAEQRLKLRKKIAGYAADVAYLMLPS